MTDHWNPRYMRQKRPPGTEQRRMADVMAAVLHLYVSDANVTVRSIGRLVDLSPMVVHKALGELRDIGLVTWDTGHNGTIRPTIAVVIPKGGLTNTDLVR